MGNTKDGLSVLAISDFPSINYAKFYSTKRKSVKNALDSSLKLISYSSVFVSNFWVEAALAILTSDAKIDEYEISLSDESKAFFTLFRLVE